MERARPGTERCCGGLLTPDARTALASLGLALPDDVRLPPEPRSVHVHDLDSGREQTYRRDYLNIDRTRFDAWLLALAKERVEVKHSTSFVGPVADGVVLRTGDRTQAVRTRLVIGADGANSTVRRKCFPERPGPPLLLALQAQMARERPLEAHVVLFARALTSFYAWAVPKAETVLVGCAFAQRQQAREHFEEVLAWYSRTLGLIERPGERSARLLSQPRARSEVFAGKGNVMLAGEAAGLISPSSGEGISFALSSGAGAGRAVASASPGKAYAEQFKPLARRVLAKTVKARIIYSPAARSWALRLPWCP